jgi:ketosteroid isomerase-like protein
MSNSAIVQEIYAAFGRGDVPDILEKLADDVDWEYVSSTDVPWLQRRRGRDAVAGFFQSLDALEFRTFDVRAVIEGDGVVIALIDIDLTVKATGKRIAEEDEIHVWRFNSQGKVARFRHGADTHGHHIAYHG